MSIEWRCHTKFDVRRSRGDAADEGGQVALQVNAESEEVRNHGDAVNAGRGKNCYSLFESGMREFEERDFEATDSSLECSLGRDLTNRLIGGLHAGAVSEEDDAGAHVRRSHIRR